MRVRARDAWWATLLCGAVGCGAGEDLPLGRDTPLNAKLCTVPADRPLHLDFHVSLRGLVCPDGNPCDVAPELIKAAPDGSAWVLGRRSAGSILGFIVWLGHFGPDGSLLGAADVANSTHPELAVDDESHAWIAADQDATAPRSRMQLQRYDAAVRSLGARIELEGLQSGRLGWVPGRGMALTAQKYIPALSRVLALLNPVGELLWSSEEPAENVSAPVPIGLGQIGLSMGPLVEGPSPMTTLQAYGPDGALLWAHLAPPDVTTHDFSRSYYEIEGDVGGNLTVVVPDKNGAWVRRIRAGGEPDWLWSLDVRGGFAVEYDTGRVFAGTMEGFERVIIQELSADGQSCRKYAHRGVPEPTRGQTELPGPEVGISPLRKLSISPTGELYFLTSTTVGRFMRIEP